jgi:hypothetical protein
MLPLPVGISPDFRDDSTLGKDVFDGIEDIYVDLEANPPPPLPSSKDDIFEATRLNLSSSSTSSSFSIGINKNVENEEALGNEGEFAYLCGMRTSKNPSGLTNMFNIFKDQSYMEMEDDKEKKTKNEAPPKLRVVMDSVGEQSNDEGEMKKTTADQKQSDGPNFAFVPDTIIQHTITEHEVREAQVKKAHPSVRDILQQQKLFRVSKESEGRSAIEGTNDEDGTIKDKVKMVQQYFLDILRQRNLFGCSEKSDSSSTVIAANTSMERDIDEAAIRKGKLKKYFPSFWGVLGQRKLFGLSYRFFLLASIILFAMILLIILITHYSGRSNTTGSNSLIDSGSPDVASIEGESTLFYDDDSNFTNELRELCDEEGVTIEDGVILTANQVMEKGKYFCSPSKTYILGMMDDLSIVHIRTQYVVWSAGVTQGARTVLQEDGVMVIENEAGATIWNTGVTPGITGRFIPQLVFWENNEGMIALQQKPAIGVSQVPFNFWMDGFLEYEYCDDCQRENLEFPVRGSFHSSTYDDSETAWQDIMGNLPMHYSDLGYYSSSDPNVITTHVEAMEYGKIDLGISSWEGPGTNFDRSRITMLLEETSKQNAGLKWTISYQVERRRGRLSPAEIQFDLEYLKKWFAWQPAWAHIDGKPVVYVNNDANCDVAERWMTGAANDWYVVLRVFDGYERCSYQPDSWYDQRVNDFNDGIDIREGLYYNLAPGQWSMGRLQPELERLSPGEWCSNVQDMVDSNEQWQLIVSFNDANLGTSIEPSLDWRSASKYGSFLDCLHDPQIF